LLLLKVPWLLGYFVGTHMGEIVIVKRLISFEKYFVKVCIPVYKLVMCSSPCFEGRESSLLGGCDPGDRTRQRMQLLCCWKVGLA
jgi:hypothetical protein